MITGCVSCPLQRKADGITRFPVAYMAMHSLRFLSIVPANCLIAKRSRPDFPSTALGLPDSDLSPQLGSLGPALSPGTVGLTERLSPPAIHTASAAPFTQPA
jgi:hypothetical protein